MISIYHTTEGQSLYDVGISIYGSQDSYGDLILQNPTIDLNTAIPTGTAISYDDSKVYLKQVIVAVPIIETRPLYFTAELQSVYDLAIQLYGDISGLINMVSIFSDLNNILTKGTQISPINTDSFLANTFFKDYIVQTFSQIGNISANDIDLEDGFTPIVLEDGVTHIRIE